MTIDKTRLQVAGVYYVTTDYSMFKELHANRGVLKIRFDRLVKSFSVKEIMNPIIVNSEMQIIDGQGRFEAKKFLKKPIFYIIDDSATIEDCRRMNMYNAPWTNNDFINSFADDGNENYIILRETLMKSGISFGGVMKLAHKGYFGSETWGGALKEGTLKFDKDDAERVIESVKKIEEIRNALCFSNRVSEAFVSACAVMFNNEKYDHKSFLKNCIKSRSSFAQMSKLEDQLKEFSRVFNLGKHSDSKVYFEDYMRNRGAHVRDYTGQAEHFAARAKESIKTLGKE